ncbi:uncharacterized protein [Dermacentor albipictus]|uniref:uncharacterized protein n=1 Tax=Dermacentor albipictus TaxID=60249 RepID=UPI0031FC3EC0
MPQFTRILLQTEPWEKAILETPQHSADILPHMSSGHSGETNQGKHPLFPGRPVQILWSHSFHSWSLQPHSDGGVIGALGDCSLTSSGAENTPCPIVQAPSTTKGTCSDTSTG